MSETKERVKSIIMDKAGEVSDSTGMVTNLGYSTNNMAPLATALNAEFSINVTATQLSTLATVGAVCTFIEGIVGE